MNRRAFLSLAALALSACENPIPRNPEWPAPDGYSDAIEIVRTEWSERLEIDLEDPPPVHWFRGPCLDYPASDDPRCLLGHYVHRQFAEEVIHVVWRSQPSQSAMAHEMLHWALDVRGDSDSDHNDPAWGQLGEIEDILLAADL